MPRRIVAYAIDGCPGRPMLASGTWGTWMKPAGPGSPRTANATRSEYIEKLQRYVPAVFESSDGILSFLSEAKMPRMGSV